MHRTQIYFEEAMFQEIKKRARKAGLSISAYIRHIIAKELAPSKKTDRKKFAGLWENRDVSLESLRKKAWK